MRYSAAQRNDIQDFRTSPRIRNFRMDSPPDVGNFGMFPLICFVERCRLYLLTRDS